MVCAVNYQKNRIVKKKLAHRNTLIKTYPPILTEDVHEIINRAKEGNQIAFSRLLDRFWNDVYGFQLKRTENENDAEDITIQTFSKAFDKINTYDNRFAFKTWLITISKNIHIDLVRKRKKSLLDSRRNEDAIKSVYDESLTMEDQLIQEQNLADLLRDIKSLKPHYQEVINLRYFNELSYADIAEKLNEPINNIKVKILRAKKLLSEVIRNRR